VGPRGANGKGDPRGAWSKLLGEERKKTVERGFSLKKTEAEKRET